MQKITHWTIISRFWLCNGSIFILDKEGGQRKKIEHFSNLKEIFPGFDFDTRFW